MCREHYWKKVKSISFIYSLKMDRHPWGENSNGAVVRRTEWTGALWTSLSCVSSQSVPHLCSKLPGLFFIFRLKPARLLFEFQVCRVKPSCSRVISFATIAQTCSDPSSCSSSCTQNHRNFYRKVRTCQQNIYVCLSESTCLTGMFRSQAITRKSGYSLLPWGSSYVQTISSSTKTYISMCCSFFHMSLWQPHCIDSSGQWQQVKTWDFRHLCVSFLSAASVAAQLCRPHSTSRLWMTDLWSVSEMYCQDSMCRWYTFCVSVLLFFFVFLHIHGRCVFVPQVFWLRSFQMMTWNHSGRRSYLPPMWNTSSPGAAGWCQSGWLLYGLLFIYLELFFFF